MAYQEQTFYLIRWNVIDKERKFNKIKTSGQCYNKFTAVNYTSSEINHGIQCTA